MSKKSCLVKEAYTDNNKIFILMELWSKPLYNMQKASINYFATYHLYYKKKSEMIESIIK